MLRCLIIFAVVCIGIPASLHAQTPSAHIELPGAIDPPLIKLRKEELDGLTQALDVMKAKVPIDEKEIVLLYFLRGVTLHSMGEYDKAIADFDQVVAIDPTKDEAYVFRGCVWRSKGEPDKAIADDNRALAIDPNDAFAYTQRGWGWRDKGEYEKAIADYKKVVEMYPEAGGPYVDLAFSFATCPDAKYRDGKKAVEYASKAQQLFGFNDHGTLLTLAAAYAECGDFINARKFAEEAIAMASGEDKQICRTHHELYKQGKPYHAPPAKK